MARKPSWYVTAAERRRDKVRDKRVRYRDTVRKTREQEKAVKARKRGELKEVTSWCDEERKKARNAVTTKCNAKRQKVRSAAQEEIDKLGAKRREHRQSWLYYATGHGAAKLGRGQVKVSPSESDSMAEHNIPKKYLPLWRRNRRSYSYDKQPDYRAEAFMEWVDTQEGQNAFNILQEEMVPSDAQFARQEARYYAERGIGPGIVSGEEQEKDFGDFLDDLEEAVPF